MQFRPPCQGGPWPRAASNIFASSPPITTTVLQPVQKINIRQLPQRPTLRFWERKRQLVCCVEKVWENIGRRQPGPASWHLLATLPWNREVENVQDAQCTPAHCTDLPVIATLPELVTHLASGSACKQVQQDNHVFINITAMKDRKKKLIQVTNSVYKYLK